MRTSFTTEVFLASVPPNHWGEEGTWLEELRHQLLDPVARETLAELVRQFSEGVPQQEPVVVDNDGVVDGHSRVLALWIAGAAEVRFERSSRK